MKTFKFYVILILTCLLGSGSLYSQYWFTTGNPAGPTDFLGTTNNQLLDFKTDNINGMRLMQTSTTTVDGYTIDNSGFLGLSTDPLFFTQKEPYSLLHLNGDFNIPFPQELGYRSWMRPGITFTHNGDLMYVGPKRNSQDITDAVISWSDNGSSSSIGSDVLRFLFKARKMDDQKNALLHAFDEWRGENEQIDDVCMVGVRIV